MKSLEEAIDNAIHMYGEPVSSTGPNDSADPAEAGSDEMVLLMRAAKSRTLSGAEIARRIDHTLLKAEARSEDLIKLCDEARAHHFASVCVNTSRIEKVAQLLQGSPVLPIAVVGFPLGAMETHAKAFETRRAVELGAKEIDMVLAIGALKSKEYRVVFDDIHQVVTAAAGMPVKVILETCLLSREEKIAACVLSQKAGAAFVKTSTGFSSGGATVDDVRLMRRVVGYRMGVKASGGIRTREDALSMIAAGASRIGASASVAMVSEHPSATKTPSSGGLY